MVNLEVFSVTMLPCVVLFALPCVILLTYRRAPVRDVASYLLFFLFCALPPLAGRAPCMALRGGCYAEREYDLRHVALSRDLARRSRLSGGVSQWRSAPLSSRVTPNDVTARLE